MIELPEFFTAQQARDAANEVSGSAELIKEALNELRNLMDAVIKPIVLRGGSCAYLEFDTEDSAFYVRWKIKAALEANGFSVVETWTDCITWKVSWSNE